MRARILATAGITSALVSVFAPLTISAEDVLILAGAIMFLGNVVALVLPKELTDNED